MEAEGLRAFGIPGRLRKRPGCIKAFVQTTPTHYHCKLSSCWSSSTAAAAVIIFRRAALDSSRKAPVTMSGESTSAKDLVHPFSHKPRIMSANLLLRGTALDIGNAGASE